MSPFNHNPKRLISDYYEPMMDIAEDFQGARKEFKPKQVVKVIQDQYGFSYCVLHKFVMKNYVRPMEELGRIKKVQRGNYIYL